MIADHFWPAAYPGLIVGLLYGVALRQRMSWLAGGIGGLFGSASALLLLGLTGITADFVILALTIAAAVAGAIVASAILVWIWPNARRLN